MKKCLFILLVATITFSCKDAKKENAEVAISEAVIKPEVKLYTFSGGTVFVNNLEVFSQDKAYEGQTKEFSDAFYVVEHPNGTLMWDAGLPEMLVGQPDFTDPSGTFTVSRKDSLINQLSTINISVDAIDFIALSHTHFDHSGHANVLKNSTWLVQESEYDFITSDESQKNSADNYNAIKELTNVKKLKGDFDVFGDGSVVIMSMPGHTPGHQVLFLDLAKKGPTLLSGDLYHMYESRANKRVPVFNSDVGQTLRSMDAFEAFAKEQNAEVYLQHQKEDFEKMPVAPKYLN